MEMSIIKEIIQDEKINKDERYMLVILNTLEKDENNFIEINLSALAKHFYITTNRIIAKILKSLEEKCYIEIMKIKGCINKYRLLKSYKDENKVKSGATEVTSSNAKKVCSNSYQNVTSALELPTSSDLDIPGGGYKQVPTSQGGDMDRVKTLQGFEGNTQYKTINNKYINNNIYNINKNIYINILNTWNNKNINLEERLSEGLVNTIKNTLNNINFQDIIKAIENYSKVYNSNHYYNHKWTLNNFLSRPNGINRFLDSGDLWLNYKSKYYSYYDTLKELGINYEDYIN